jgi:hypothetical protein
MMVEMEFRLFGPMDVHISIMLKVFLQNRSNFV